MRQFYFDANVVFRIDDNLVGAVCEAQRQRRLRAVIGWRVVWELAGAFGKTPERIPDARRQAGSLVAILEAGGNFARDSMDFCHEALTIPSTKRWDVEVLPAKTSDWYLDGLTTLKGIAGDDPESSIGDWYRRYEAEAASYRAAEDHFYSRLREVQDSQKPAKVSSLRNVLDDLEGGGWLPNVTAEYARQVGFIRKIPAHFKSDWFGPLGRLMRASIGLAVLQFATHEGRKKQPRKSSDFADVVHIVAAGMRGDFVTRDETAKKVFNATWPTESKKCMHFEREFLPWLRR